MAIEFAGNIYKQYHSIQLDAALAYNKMNVFGEKGFYLAHSDYIFTVEVDRNKISSYEYN